ncbi:hypothetical protein RND81_10G091400 [Saponaria officinalis]|uniref:Uncharacterized protein n=1 Tax=Saponaria officinalis TaxID=3572 RepID=A0AAW1HZE8_SAPOF
MEQSNPKLLQIDELSPEIENISNVQVKSVEEHCEMYESGSDEEYSLRTPEQKITSQKGNHDSETYLNSGNLSSDVSTKEGSEAMSSSSSSSDAESGTYGGILQPIMIETEGDDFNMKENLENLDIAEDGDVIPKEKDTLYENLLEKVANYEAELKFARNKLQASQDEISKLKYENLTLVEELGGTLEKLRVSEDDMKEMETKFRNELRECRDCFEDELDLANQSVRLLQTELASEKDRGFELQETISRTRNDLTDCCREVDELKLALHDAQKDFSKEKSRYESEIAVLHDQNGELKIRLDETEMRREMLDEQIKQNEAKEANLVNEVGQFQIEISEKNRLVESLNKSLDSIKLKYDTLMSEKDEIFAKQETLQAEVKCRDIEIQQLQGEISKLKTEREEVIEKSQRTEEELRVKVTEQQIELEKQRAWICEREDEKREAIRQLCYSIEYYRSEYHDLRHVLLKYKPISIVSS